MNIKDDFSFQEIFQTIKKSSKQFLVIFIVIVLICFLFIFLSPIKYRYSESLKVPTYYSVEQRAIIEVFPSKKLLEDILLQYLPTALSQYVYDHPNKQLTFSEKDISYLNNGNISGVIALSIVNDSFNIKISTNGFGDVYLSSIDKFETKEFYKTLFNNIQKAIQESNDSSLAIVKKNFEEHLTELENQLKQQHRFDNLINEPAPVGDKSYLMENLFLQQVTATSKNVSLADQILSLKVRLNTMQSTKIAADFVFSKTGDNVTAVAIIFSLFLAFFVSFFAVLFMMIFRNICKKRADK